MKRDQMTNENSKLIKSKIVTSLAWTIGPQRSEDRMALYILSTKERKR